MDDRLPVGVVATLMVTLPFAAVLLTCLATLPAVQELRVRMGRAFLAAARAWQRPDAVAFADVPPPATGPWPRFRHAELLEDTYHRFEGTSALALHLDLGTALHCVLAIRFPGHVLPRRRQHRARVAIWFAAAGPGAERWTTLGGRVPLAMPPADGGREPWREPWREPPDALRLDAPLAFVLDDRVRVVAEVEPQRVAVRRLRVADLRRLVEAGCVETCVQGRVVALDAAHQEAVRELLWRLERAERRERLPRPDRDDPGGGWPTPAEPVGPPADARPTLART